MRKFNVLIALLIAVMVVGNAGSVWAQAPTEVENYVFASPAEWLEGPRWFQLTADAELYPVPDTGYESLASLNAGWNAQVIAYQGSGTWGLIRTYNPSGGYEGHGWLQLTNTQETATAEFIDPSCELSDAGQQLDVLVRFNEGWIVDSFATGCNYFAEGRLSSDEELHRYWILRDVDPNDPETQHVNTIDTQHGFLWILEGTSWIHPVLWNVGTFGDADNPPMIEHFMGDKFQVMEREGYAWPVKVHPIFGSIADFEYDSFEPNVVDRCEWDAPSEMNITGIFVAADKSFRSTSVGAEDCVSVLLWTLPDGEWQLLILEHTDENLLYRTVQSAAILPSAWNSTQIVDYALGQVSSLPSGTHVSVEDNIGTGLPTEFDIE